MPDPETRRQRIIRDTLIGVIGILSGVQLETLYRGLGQTAIGYTGLDERAMFDWLEKSVAVALRKPGAERRILEFNSRRRTHRQG
jgi:hypothetical protein